MNIRFKKSLQWLLVAFLLTLAVLPVMTFAQQVPPPNSGDVFLLDGDDLSKKTFIDPLFGPLVGAAVESPLTPIIQMFNSALLLLGGIFMAYTVVAGTMKTAHEGEMMGRGWSSMWIPIRTALGVGMVLPVIGGGWCVAQAIVVWLAMQGAGLANSLWDSFIGPDLRSISASATYTPPMSLSAIRETYSTMLVNSTCVAAFQNENASSGGDATLFSNPNYAVTVLPSANATPTKENNVLKFQYIQEGGLVGAMATSRCGQVIIEEDIGEDESSTSTTASSEALRMSDITTPVAAARWNEFIQANERLKVLGAKIASVSPEQGSSLQEEVNQTMEELIQSYSTNVGNAAKVAFALNVQQGFVEEIKKDGWIMAGAFYMQLAKTQDLVTRSVTNAPVTTSPNLMQDVPGTFAEETKRWMFGAENVGPSTELARQLVGQASEDAGSLAAIGNSSVKGTSKDSGYWQSRVINWFMNKDEAGWTYDGVADVNENPIIMAKGLGEKMITTAWSALGAFSAFTVFGAGGLGSSIAPVFSMLFMALLIPGATLSTYLPLLPYILWLGVVLGWGILLIEAVIAAPLWAVVHLAPDGDGVVGRGGQGYMLVLSLVLRPPLMIIGLVAAFVLMKPIGFLINSTFVGAFSIGVSPGMFGITQAIAGGIIYAVILIITVQRVFSLIHVIPDRLLRWIGGGGGGELGQEAQSLDQGTTAKMSAGLAVGANQIGNSILSAGSNAQQARLAKRDRKAHEDAQKELQSNQMIESAKGNYADKDQDANMASYMASDNPGSESHARGAEVAHGKAVRAAEDSAINQSSKDTSQSAEDFRSGLKEAESREAGGEIGARGRFMDQQTLAAQDRVRNGGSLQPFQEALMERAKHKQQQADHGNSADSIRQARQDQTEGQRNYKAFMDQASQADRNGRIAGGQAAQQAAASSHPEARAFTQDLNEARKSGAPGAKSAVFDAATTKALDTQRGGGDLQPFQQQLIERDNYNKDMERHLASAAASVPTPSQGSDEMPEDPAADDTDGLPPSGAR